MTEQQAIESTYFDSFCSFRRQNIKDDVTKQTRQVEVQIVSDSPCALSKSSGGSLSFVSSHAEAKGAYTLFHSPELDVKEGDKLVITSAPGQIFSCYAAKPFLYSSHAETSCTEEKRT